MKDNILTYQDFLNYYQLADSASSQSDYQKFVQHLDLFEELVKDPAHS
ncbi:hypothetical protein L0B53_04140 [Vibrio sp. SS-MA-C1-2]|nr:hypothetical protein [Vibrio sp. SS-MA-C1-2]UJF17113.1 hypothetical protein L0B53_04140 [Vibrio sp. SS-MA-C1-2]